MKPPIELAPPGAGLPKWRLFFIRPLFRFASKRVPRKKFTALYQTERQRILDLAEGLSDEQKSQQILIPQIAGIEDSSRFWSIYMTLEHLTIVDQGLSGILISLCKNEAINLIVRVEDVKPSDSAKATTEKAFRVMSAKTTKQLKAIDQLDNTRTHKHPWFGPITARQWHALRAIHLKIHRRQIEEISKKL